MQALIALGIVVWFVVSWIGAFAFASVVFPLTTKQDRKKYRVKMTLIVALCISVCAVLGHFIASVTRP